MSSLKRTSLRSAPNDMGRPLGAAPLATRMHRLTGLPTPKKMGLPGGPDRRSLLSRTLDLDASERAPKGRAVVSLGSAPISCRQGRAFEELRERNADLGR
jgi:hypothetical protein